MSTVDIDNNNNAHNDIHGLTYPSHFLPSLQILIPRPSPHQPIRRLPLPEFNDIHFRALLSHAPDSVLFPFLHGLEGTNHAQNMFFATGSTMSGGASRHGEGMGGKGSGLGGLVVPRFRGLIWVVCEEDLVEDDKVPNGGVVMNGNTVYDDMEDLEEDFYSSEDEEEDGEDCDMDITSAAAAAGEMEFAMDVDDGDADQGQQTHIHPPTDENAHMHPVQHRSSSAQTTPTQTPTNSSKKVPTTAHIGAFPTSFSPPPSPSPTSPPPTSQSQIHDRRPSNASTTTSTSTCSSHDDDDTDTDTYSVSTSATSFLLPASASGSTGSCCSSPGGSLCPSPVVGQGGNGGGLPLVPESEASPAPAATSGMNGHATVAPQSTSPSTNTQQNSSQSQVRPQLQPNQTPPPASTPSPNPPAPKQPQQPHLLTSTFRPKDLLRTNTHTGEPEFVPPRVPDGISLRNFGIQVPIYATLSDIVIYSPKGLTRASMALAERFKVAVEKKAAERRERVKAAAPALAPAPNDNAAGEDDLISYNVFILDATASEMVEQLPHLMVRLHDSDSPNPNPDCSGDHAHTQGTDGQTSGEPIDKNARSRSRKKANTIDFALREKEEMRDLTKASEIISVGAAPTSAAGSADGSVVKVGEASSTTATATAVPLDLSGSTTASHWDPTIGQIFLGNSNDVPLVPDPTPSTRLHTRNNSNMDLYSDEPPPPGPTTTSEDDPFTYTATNDPSKGFGYDICVECHEMAPFPSTAHLRAADEHLQMLDALWADRNGQGPGHPQDEEGDGEGEKELPVRPPPNANAIIHLPFPSSPPSTAAAVASLLPFVKFLERVVQPVQPIASPLPPSAGSSNANSHPRRWSSVSSLVPSFPASSSYQNPRSRSSTSPSSSFTPRLPKRTRPLKVLIYSSDGYTESSVPALCLLMALRGLSLPEAYLELQVVKKRSFFVYQGDLGVLRRVEGRLMSEREQERARGMGGSTGRPGFGGVVRTGSSGSIGRQNGWARFSNSNSIYGNGNEGSGGGGYSRPSYHSGGRPAANSISITMPTTTQGQASTSFSAYALSSDTPPPAPMMIVPSQNHLVKSRPRASTSPWLPSLFEDHQSWFSDPRFDGSFPSRVLPFLYLGNLNHASNAYMLHALGITHVVSVGECALVPPHHDGEATAATCHRPVSSNAQFIAGKGPGGQGSLWIEEREGRIKVLDIKGVCDDGIDTLEPQLEPICEWIEKARSEGGQVLVHCRVGVSRSATVTIAYVMKHLNLPLVDAYLIVRSRRLSVLIQPNMRLLYNLCGWEVKLARERAGDDEEQLKNELARTLSWPYLAREVHSLNEKYLH